jgi:hypothetical protein
MAADRDRRATARSSPFKDFLGPARRRTDHPLVVGMIVLCLVVITVGTLVQIVGTFWAGSQVRLALAQSEARDRKTMRVREALYKNTEAQALVLRRLCLNTARSEADQKECLTLGAPLPTTAPE